MKHSQKVALIALAALAAGVVLSVGKVMPVDETLASWRDAESTRATYTAGTVSPPRLLQCSVANPYLAPVVTFSWSEPTPGATRARYHWYLTSSTNGAIANGTVAATATSYVLTQTVDYGTMNFRIVAEGNGTWTSVDTFGTVSRVLLQGVSCSASAA